MPTATRTNWRAGSRRSVLTGRGSPFGRGSITVVKDQVTDYVIDFDACNSVLRLGNTGNYELSPKLSVVQRPSGSFSGMRAYVTTYLIV